THTYLSHEPNIPSNYYTTSIHDPCDIPPRLQSNTSISSATSFASPTTTNSSL
ncbi:18070_t:CDS:1, partial [Racocetra persica]